MPGAMNPIASTGHVVCGVTQIFPIGGAGAGAPGAGGAGVVGGCAAHSAVIKRANKKNGAAPTLITRLVIVDTPILVRRYANDLQMCRKAMH